MSIRRDLVQPLPDILTAANLFCGCLSVAAAFNHRPAIALAWIVVAALFDFLDGFVARMLRVQSEYGKILDSLADVVSFGVAPATMLFNLFEQVYVISPFILGIRLGNNVSDILSASSFLIAVFSGLRLAKFHLDTRQTDAFIGLPTPANALFWAALVCIFHKSAHPFVIRYLATFTFLIPLMILSCYLMISEIPMFALKFKSFRWAENKKRYFFILVSALLIGLFNITALPLIILFYVLFSIIRVN